MNLSQLYTPGDSAITLTGDAGMIEAMIMCPEEYRTDYVAILGHPHSLYGGSMQNKVVTTLARTFRDLGIPSLRFNFRGVGNSSGTYDQGRGESEDFVHIATMLQTLSSDCKFCFAGFSFGSYVSTVAALKFHPDLLISIAPAVTHFDFEQVTQAAPAWIIVQGDQDEVVDAQAVYRWIAQLSPPPTLIRFPESGHFFHGKLTELKNRLTPAIIAALNLT